LQATNYYLSEEFENAFDAFQHLEIVAKDTAQLNTSHYLKVLILDELYQYHSAKITLQKWLGNNFKTKNDSVFAANFINENFSKKFLPKILSTDKARALAIFIPGGGHFYCGAFKEGVINAGLQITTLAATGICIYYGYYTTAAIVSFGLFNRFHSGAIQRVEFLVPQKNYLHTHHFNNVVRQFIETEKLMK
jgi:hypothetical protein